MCPLRVRYYRTVHRQAIHFARRTLRVSLALVIVIGISLAEFVLGRVNNATVALTLLLAILGIATRWGLLESLAASVAAMLSFNYLFLPPVRTWTIADPDNWVALVTFVITAALASHLSASAKRRAVAQAHAEDATRRAEEARQSEEMKSAMLDALAHEFKTPLTAIKAAVSALLSRPSSVPSDRELLLILEEDADRLIWLVDEAVQIARIEAGRMEVRKQPVSIAPLIREALHRMSGLLESRNVQQFVDEGLPTVPADRELVLIVLRLLIENAAKYSPPGSPIVIRASSNGDAVIVSVADHGPGIAPADLGRIFDKFYRGAQTRGQVPGMGLGLAIAREIVRGHGGDIMAVSQLGRGSEFSFHLPLPGEGQHP